MSRVFGNIQCIKHNQQGTKTYGFILGEDSEDYFFHKTSLQNCTIFQLEDGDSVEFDPEIANNSRRAINIRKRSTSVSESVQSPVTAGINPNIKLDNLNSDERKIVEDYLQETFYVTNGGRSFMINNCTYNFILIKPTDIFTTLFNLTREIIVVFSDYVNFEPRSLDAAPEAVKYVPATLRLDRGCHILISNDSNIEVRIHELFKDTNLNSIVIPFSYHEFLSGKMDRDAIINRFKKYLFDADLFSTKNVINNDLFFFGRRDYVQDIAAKCKQGVHCGVFGLRRSGKTSLLHAVRRKLEAEGYTVIYIPCQKDLSNLNWKSALHEIVKKVQKALQFDLSKLSFEDAYRKNSAHAYFEADMNVMLEGMSHPIILLFDEIESITFDVQESQPSWREGNSFKDFWNVLKGYYSEHLSKITIVVAGTNPMINEEPLMKLSQHPNPMYGQFSMSNQGAYLPPFDIDSTCEMINTLGAYMGILFQDSVAAAMTEDCGGHPYLIRLLCGSIKQYIQKSSIPRPVTVSRGIYEAARNEFEKSNDVEGFYLMILHILQTSYIKEYNTLKILATDGDTLVSQVADNTSLGRLLGYGLIENNAGHYAIRFDMLKRFLQNTYRFEREKISIKEQKAEINYRFDAAEIRLRDVIRRELRSSFKEPGAKQAFLDAMQNNRAVSNFQLQKAAGLTYKQLFDPTVNTGCFFTVLIDIIDNNYSEFENTFETSKEDVKNHLLTLNRARRLPSHSAPENPEKWSDEDFKKFRVSMKWLEEVLDNAD